MGGLLGLEAKVMTAVELHLMDALDWAPTAGWQERRKTYNA